MIAEDLDAFLKTADFAETALFGGVPVTGIFDKAYAENFGVAGSGPAFTCKEADLADIVPGTSTLVIRSYSWLVTGVEADGTGLAIVRLQRT